MVETLSPSFTVIVLAEKAGSHLLAKTIDSIVAQKEIPFEIIIVERLSAPVESLGEKNIPHIRRIYSSINENLFAMMNKGLKFASGDYIHFMMPGEFYTSELTFAFIAEALEKDHLPDLLSTGFIVRHLVKHPRVIFHKLTKEGLERTRYHASLLPYFFKGDLFHKKGHFNLRYPLQGNFDYLCRLAVSSDVSVKYLKRVVTDYEMRKFSPDLAMKEVVERLQIIYDHYGFGKAFFWWVAQNHRQFFRWWLQVIKGAVFRVKP